MPNHDIASNNTGYYLKLSKLKWNACVSSCSFICSEPNFNNTCGSLGTFVTSTLYHFNACLILPACSYAFAIWYITSGDEDTIDWIFSYAWIASLCNDNLLLTNPKLNIASTQSASTPIASN